MQLETASETAGVSGLVTLPPGVAENTAHHARNATRALLSNLDRVAPFAAERATAWMVSLARSHDPASYYLRPRAFPLLSLPRWFAESHSIAADEALEADVTHSSIHGGYYIRLIDNVMDEGRARERVLLPLLHVFHYEFLRPYLHRFAADHEFWRVFQASWGEMADCTLQDAVTNDFERGDFERVAARKVCAAEIPLAAAAYHYGRCERVEEWRAFLAVLGCWFQLFNDLRDWHNDHRAGLCTWLNSEARRRRGDTLLDLTVFMDDEGLDWASVTVQPLGISTPRRMDMRIRS